jgi:hypothetical protein
MPYAVVEFQPTPNPNALKCVLDRPLPAPAMSQEIHAHLRSYRHAAEAAADPVAAALLALPGVATVLVGEGGGWVTVNKAPAADWPAVKKGVKAVLAAQP